VFGAIWGVPLCRLVVVAFSADGVVAIVPGLPLEARFLWLVSVPSTVE
jgi:hypothetical protein